MAFREVECLHSNTKEENGQKELKVVKMALQWRRRRRRRWREAFLMMVARKAVVMIFSSAINILPQTERKLGKSDMGSKSG